MADTLETMFEKRFAEVQKRREDLLARRAKIDEQLHAVEDEYQRVKTAQAALEGKFRATSTERKPRADSGLRAPRSDRRQKILKVVEQHPEGLTAEQVATELGITDKQGRQYVSTTLSMFKSKNKLVGGGRGLPYRVPDVSSPEEGS